MITKWLEVLNESLMFLCPHHPAAHVCGLSIFFRSKSLLLGFKFLITYFRREMTKSEALPWESLQTVEGKYLYAFQAGSTMHADDKQSCKSVFQECPLTTEVAVKYFTAGASSCGQDFSALGLDEFDLLLDNLQTIDSD